VKNLFGLKTTEIDRNQIEHEKITILRDFGKAVAHEIRTPVSTVLLQCELMNRETVKETPNLKTIVSGIKKVGKEAYGILLYIDMILLKLNKKNELFSDFKELSMKNCVLDALEQYPLEDEEKKIITFECDEDFIIKGNKHSVTHIFFNLLQNAIYQIKSANKGEIVISLLKQETGNVLLFKDTASGVNSSVCGKLFSPMVSEKFSATGLGLYYCKNAMEAMGGTINCNTIPEKFAEFILTFPKVADSNT
jgi:signal transduction histidine kinase